MGYNLYVVKSRGCLDRRNRFTEAEWNEICANHQVADWLCFDGNDITVKNPSREQIVALVHVAKRADGVCRETMANHTRTMARAFPRHGRPFRPFFVGCVSFLTCIAARRRRRNPCRWPLVPSRSEIGFVQLTEAAVS